GSRAPGNRSQDALPEDHRLQDRPRGVPLGADRLTRGLHPHAEHQLRGSWLARASLVCFSRCRRTASPNSLCLPPTMVVASRAAFTAPARPMASVPTGIPAGIWTIDRRESSPCNDLDSMGTPSTGRAVLAATTPAR